MAKDKYDFIQELLENKKLKPAQQERILMLTKEEIKKDGVFGKELEERVKKLEEMFDNKTIKAEETTVENNIMFMPKQYFNPADLHSFLRAYNDDMILKGTCHPVDSEEIQTINSFCGTDEYNFESHYKKIFEHYENLKNTFKDKFVDKKLKALIETYIKGGGNWNHNIKHNWASPELLKWAKKNPKIPPNLDSGLYEDYNNIGYEIDEFAPKIKLLDRAKIQTFGDLTQYFKYLYHLRSDNSLLKLCKNINQKYDIEIDFDYEDIDSRIELFTNVEKLLETYKGLMDLVLEVQRKNNLERPKIKLSFYSDDKNNIKFSIHHLNSVYKHTVLDAVERPGQKFKNLIQNQLNGLCEFYINANFGNSEFAKLVIWDYEVWKSKRLYSRKIENFIGVEYILKFKK